MKKYIVLDKEVGKTPLETVTLWKKENPSYAKIPMAYAGRLDPMASGKLLVLVGGECKKQKKYTALDKEYLIEVLLDVTTDTGDALGLPTIHQQQTKVDVQFLKKILKAEIGTHIRPYPAFSSKTVAGKPLFLYALEGTLSTITIPTHTETIHRIDICKIEHIDKSVVQEYIQKLLKEVPRSDEPSKVLGADFRQDTIRAAWGELFAKLPARNFARYTLRVVCGSGTYMRTLAPRIGSALGTGGIVLSIHRPTIGHWQRRPFGFWRYRYK